jgi:hypothetical protein
VPKVLISCEIAPPNSERLMKSPSTRSCLVVIVEKQIMRRTSRSIRVRRLMGLLAIFGVCCVPTACCSGAMCRS